MSETETPLRFGILGAASIAPTALIRPAREIPSARVDAVAARDVARAQKFADRNGIQRVHRSYEDLIADAEIDAIYNPLPNSLHCEWSVRALEAGKHVLCEKPLASNAAEARQMADAATAAGCQLVEAFHWRYHPLAERVIEILRSGELGVLQRMEVRLCFPILAPNDIRHRFELGGGATMDAGCYCVSLLRHLVGEEPEVSAAQATLGRPHVDRLMEAELRFPSGVSAHLRTSIRSRYLLQVSLRAVGERGELRILNPVAPHLFHRLSVRSPEGRRSERVAGEKTYTAQLRAFVAAVREGKELPTGAEDGVANMRVIDAIYERAGLPLRGC